MTRTALAAMLLLGAIGGAEAGRRPAGGLAGFDGGWMVSSEGPCTGLGSAQVTILHGKVIGLNGAGRVSASGAVHTISNAGGVTTVSDGQITGSTAAGTYRQSTGCVGTWTAVRL